MKPRPTSDLANMPTSRKLGYGALALLPALLLAVSGLSAVVADLGTAAQLLYVHVAAQFIVLLMFGDLLMKSRAMDSTGRVLWGAYFLLLAPAAVLSFWYVHVWSAGDLHRPRRVRTLELTLTD